jgi:hypothetical protein
VTRPARIAAPNIPNPQTPEEIDALIAEAERSIAEHGTIAWDDVNAEIERLLRRYEACERDSPRRRKNNS